jgi:hypothetical protein
VRTRDLNDLTFALTAGLPLEEAKRLVGVLQEMPRSEAKAFRNLIDVCRQAVSGNRSTVGISHRPPPSPAWSAALSGGCAPIAW